MSVILHKVLSSSLDQDLTRSCISFQAFSLASLMSACSLCTSSTCLLSTSMFRVGFFSCEYNTVWFKKALIAHHSQWSLSFLSPAVPLRWWCDPAVSAFLHNYWILKISSTGSQKTLIDIYWTLNYLLYLLPPPWKAVGRWLYPVNPTHTKKGTGETLC